MDKSCLHPNTVALHPERTRAYNRLAFKEHPDEWTKAGAVASSYLADGSIVATRLGPNGWYWNTILCMKRWKGMLRTHSRSHARTHTHTCRHARAHTHVYMCTHMHTHAHTHTHAHVRGASSLGQNAQKFKPKCAGITCTMAKGTSSLLCHVTSSVGGRLITTTALAAAGRCVCGCRCGCGCEIG